MTDRLPAAIAYAERGYSVIPITPNDKKPLIKWEAFQKARATEKEIREWWTRWPDANVGLITGTISGVYVIDQDDMDRHEIDDLLPDAVDIPTTTTPRGGRHYYFAMPGEPLGNTTKFPPGCDTRGEGGYVVAPPSLNGNGGRYRWMEGLSILEVPPPPMPPALLSLLKDSLALSYRGCRGKEEKEATNDHKEHKRPQRIGEGHRDDFLFHTANLLIKGGGTPEDATQVLEILAQHCDPPFPLHEIKNKVKSALDRAARRDMSIAREVREWVETTNGHFLTTTCHKELQLTTKDHIKAANMELSRLCQGPNPVLERYGGQRGCYRRIENDVDLIDFLHAPDAEFPLNLPLGLSSLTILYPGSVIILAGSKSAGKTAIALDIVKQNMHHLETVYVTSELWDTELKKRLLCHGDLRLTDWKMKAMRMSKPPQDFVDGTRKLYIFDYLETADADAWRIGAQIKSVHDKLKDGVAVICLQKKPDTDLARGAGYTLDKARLYVALDPLPRGNRAKIVDCKAFRGAENPRGMVREFKLVGGAKIIPQGDWREAT